MTVALIISLISNAKQKTKLEVFSENEKKLQKEFEEKESFLKKEAMIAAKEQLHFERQKFDDEVRERRSEINRLENSLMKKEDKLEERVQKNVDKEHE